jgi:DNA-binding SARP family transcriptional activator
VQNDVRTVAMTATAVRYFGNFSVRVDDRPVGRWRAGRARNLCQYLLFNHGKVIGRDRLYELLWPDGERASTTSSLKVAVHAVRQVLKDATGGTCPPVEIDCRDGGYVLLADDLRLDAEEFDACVARGRAAQECGAHTDARYWYGRALELYAGDFLAAESLDWVAEQREYSRALALHALGYLRADALRRDDHPAVLTFCRRILEIDPYHEEMYQTLMLLHGRRGELGQVRNWHEMCLRRLRDDLEVTPAETTDRIYARAMRGELRARTTLGQRHGANDANRSVMTR